MSAKDSDRFAKITLPAALLILAGAIVLHAILTRPHEPFDDVKLDGDITVSHPNNIPVAAAPFDPQGGAIIRTAKWGWYRVHPDHTVEYIGSDHDIGNR